ncbi:protein LNK3-like isoform X2 [Olea europaea var. sylvestris]|uniref:protein LNK3-like isoform X2 n=1 Tax=Olea europaea var. sylvestris TaxID=158386 RepID=UPI000C1D6D66|nr:protein LNK3-like isoform X2 [Olea europaea var. sylvestris]XP_022885055.1 protein LNK3-like isoform X2 [Olea europaea var. sylvestris]
MLILRGQLLEENESGIHAAAGSIDFSRTSSNDNVIPSNLLRDLVSESNTVQDHVEDIGHLKDPKKYISVSRDCNNGVNDDPLSVAKAMEVDIPFSLEHNSSDKHIAEEVTSMEESVYLELRSLTVKLTESTRICIRDALYRLAKNSKHEDTNHVPNENDTPEGCSPTIYREASRLGDTEEEESTNAIDRTVANLLFNHISFCSPEVECSSYDYNPCFYTSSSGAVLEGDAEVPTFGLINHPPPMPRD